MNGSLQDLCKEFGIIHYITCAHTLNKMGWLKGTIDISLKLLGFKVSGPYSYQVLGTLCSYNSIYY